MEESVQRYARDNYAVVDSMNGVSVGVIDLRDNTAESSKLLNLFRRYLDSSQLITPGVLSLSNPPNHVFVVATNIDKLREVANQVVPHSSTKVVGLLAGEFDERDSIPQVFDALYVINESSLTAIDVLVQAAFGGIAICGKQPKTRLSYTTTPEMEGMSAEKLNQIDVVMKKAIADRATPGGFVMVIRHGRVVFSKAYGRTIYNGKYVNENHLYDIASMSKVVGTLPIVVQLFDQKLLRTDSKLGEFIEDLPSEKQEITIESLLLHTSGLPAAIPAFMLCVDSATLCQPVFSSRRRGEYQIQIEPSLYIRSGVKLNPTEFSKTYSDKYEYVVAPNLFTTAKIHERMYSAIDSVKMRSIKSRYSDLNFIYLQRIIEGLYDRDLENVFMTEFAEPLGIERLCYNPLRKYPVSSCIPTEKDQYFRLQQLQGTVHDQLAALLGGSAGNSGLFGNANEIAKIAQMYIWYGQYGGVRFWSEQTDSLFHTRPSELTRRSMGFDRPEYRPELDSPVTSLASDSSYGHSGFSGTLLWIDPEKDVIFIFLSNRICPSSSNTKLTRNNIRGKIHKIIYESIIE